MKENKLTEMVRSALDIKLSPDAELRIQSVMDQELNQPVSSGPPPVMVLNELINYLRVTPEIIEDYLEEIPCFELGGKLLFRRDAVDKWIERKEKQYAVEAADFNDREGLKFFIA